MIQANELRIGNLVINHLNEIHKIKPNNILAQYQFDVAGEQGYTPIPITEEWLLRFGFKKARTFDECNRYIIGENPVTKDWMLYLTWLDNHEYPFYKNGYHIIKYIHQLQNLYFALTQKELEYVGAN